MTVFILSTIIAIMTMLMFFISYGLYRFIKSTVETEEASVALYRELQSYRNHLESVYSRDTFYGDEVLGKLLDHTRDIEECLIICLIWFYTQSLELSTLPIMKVFFIMSNAREGWGQNNLTST